MQRSRTISVLALACLATLATACGDDAEGADPVDDPPVETTVETTAPDDDHDQHDTTVMIDGVDYGFDNVPATVPAGTRLGFRNTSSVELHELVAFRLDTDQPLDEVLALPPAELEAALGAPVTVLLQPPGAPEAIQAVGDGTLTEPGRYVMMCFIPIGADPDEYLAAVEAAGGGKPEGVAGGPPHFTAGMVAEFVVE
ncbi:MAG: hypothetical protein CL424_05150 [Acidimicrobiaceae bacterium]|nr:hypothetical protein [Acidimicrobiaceae bacterium]